MNPPMARPFCSFAGRTSQFVPPARACLPVGLCIVPRSGPYLPCPVVSCLVACPSLASRSFVRSFGSLHCNQPNCCSPLPSFPSFSDSLPLPTSHARLTSAQQQSASPAQPSNWKPSLLSQLISQLSQLDAKASQVRGNLPLPFFLKPEHRAGARSRSTPRTPIP